MRPQDLAITILGAHVREPGELVWSGGMVELLGEFGFSTEAARAALSRLAVRGLLERHRHGRRVSYSLSARADDLLAEGDRRIFSFGRDDGDGTWTVLWHAIPENRRVERAQLASRLRFLGFGSVQDATWIAAADRERDVVALVRALGAEPYCTVIVGRLSAELASAAAVAQAWDLAEVERRYSAFLAEHGRYRQAKARRALDDRGAFVVRTVMLHEFRGFPSLDPELPGARSRRRDVVKTFDLVYAALAEPAQRHFAELAQAPRS